MRLRNANPKHVVIWVTVIAILLYLGGGELLARVDAALRARAGVP